MKVFLTGGTGYIGRAVAAALKRAGHEVTSLARSEEAARKLAAQGIRAYKGDLLDVESLEKGVRGAEGVIHAASTNDANAAKADTAAVTAILKALEGTGRAFIYTSGVWVMGNTGGHVANEEKAADPAPVVAWRVDLEREIVKAAGLKIRTIIIRPALVYGHGGGLPAMLVQSARERGAARYVGTGDNHWTFVHVDDLAALYVRALEHAPSGSLFIGAHGSFPRLREVAEAASIGSGAQGRVEAWPLEEARRALGPVADALVLDQQISGEKAKHTLGWAPQAPFVLDDLKYGSYAKSTGV